ncbi:hypothetical protein PENTCL1PPCAC_29400 [Pristionchus entomophagus]|uniref:Uncharacterized protein n=1 Tax=Pristionchus entomophagus TaxID=358040 RepID=A0AAV5UJJ0_9BILA|nr:hypothetical protein PENTCL1PPCAC_29400 [Pristionchus entomophagus]
MTSPVFLNCAIIFRFLMIDKGLHTLFSAHYIIYLRSFRRSQWLAQFKVVAPHPEILTECRTCPALSIDSESECPEVGYECDDNSELKTNILSASTCECSTARCADGMQTMLKGMPVFCKNRQWTTISGNTTEAVACGKKCKCPDISSKVHCQLLGACVGLIKKGCGYSCPGDSELLYWITPDYFKTTENPSIKCKGTYYEGFPPDARDGATCAYTQYSEWVKDTLPEDSLCQPLIEYTTPEMEADFTYIRYVKDGADYYATCYGDSSSTITFPGMNPVSPLKIRCVNGNWENGVIKATCATGEGIKRRRFRVTSSLMIKLIK